MRYDETHKAETRQKLISQAATRLRRDGLNAVGLRALVADVGLTHGAFYAHFPSKAKLVEVAIKEALNETYNSLLIAIETVNQDLKLEVFVSTYLSALHWQSMDKGCVVAALAPEIIRENTEMRKALTSGMEPIISLLESLLPVGGAPAIRETRAATIFAGMIGSLQYARSYEDIDTVNLILKSARSNALAAASQSWS